MRSTGGRSFEISLTVGRGIQPQLGRLARSEAFEYLLGCSEIRSDGRLRDLLWKHQEREGFEGALAELQSAYLKDPQANNSQLMALQSAITRMFADMNSAFLDLTEWEFQRLNRERLVQLFLTRFDAIFTLNQDIFLEKHYCNTNVSLLGTRRWAAAHLPGMKRTANPEPIFSTCWARSTWTAQLDGNIKPEPQMQPIFKLHGSSNWLREDGAPLLVMGGGKAAEINRHPILRRYSQIFDEYLLTHDTRIMVIGYGFGDSHINSSLNIAVQAGLKIFVIDPLGAEIAFALSPTRKNRQIVVPSPEEEMLKGALIGGSRRPLKEVFSADGAEFGKVMRFFDP